MEHSKLPELYVDESDGCFIIRRKSDGVIMVDELQESHAHAIVKACNSYPRMLRLIKTMHRCDSRETCDGCSFSTEDRCGDFFVKETAALANKAGE